MNVSWGGGGRSTTPEGNRGHALALGTFGVKSIGTLNPLLSHRRNTRAMRVERPVESGELHKHPNRELDPHNSKEVTPERQFPREDRACVRCCGSKGKGKRVYLSQVKSSQVDLT